MILRYLTPWLIAAGLSCRLSASMVSAYVSVDAGRVTDFRNVAHAGPSTGLIALDVNDTAGGGSQSATATGYASVGLLGGRVLASTTTILQAGQGFHDLNWSTDFFVDGAPGSTVSYMFTHNLDGYVTGTGTNYSGIVNSVMYIGGDLLGDHRFDVLVQQGPFSALTSRTYTFNAGDTVHLAGRMTVTGRADQVAEIDVNALNTAALYVDVLTPGGGYRTDAGVLFPTSTSVPEPSTLGLCFLAAAVALAGVRSGFRIDSGRIR